MKNEERLGDINVSIGSNNVVGDIGHKVVAGKVQRKLAVETKQGLERMISRDRPVSVLSRQGDREGQVLAEEIHAHLTSLGYVMVAPRPGWHMFQTQQTDINVSTLATAEGVQTTVVIESAQ